MSYAISRSTRNRKLFVLVSGDKESEMEFPFAEGAKHRVNASRFTRWVDRNTTSKPKYQPTQKPNNDIKQHQMSIPMPMDIPTEYEYDDDIPF